MHVDALKMLKSSRLGIRVATIALLAHFCLATIPSDAGGSDGSIVTLEARMPPFATEREDEYLCSAVQLPEKPMKLTGIEPLADMATVHHMLLFGKK